VRACTVHQVINLAYDDSGTGEPVVFIAGLGGAGRGWHLHQVPAFVAAGYRVITFDNRGIGATANADGFTTETMVGDTAALIETLGAAPARVVGVSMGAYIAQELMLARPELVSKAVLMATRGRLDCTREFSAPRTPSWPHPASSCRPRTVRESACWRAFRRKH
jgi:pimeloyl-ACP methyl ester carboxylesterase